MRQIVIYILLMVVVPCFSQNSDDVTLKNLAEQITIKATSPEEPVCMNASLFLAKENDLKKDVLMVKAKVHENWHIYAFVPEGGFFIQSELKLKLPDGVEATLVKEPSVYGYEADPQIMLYKGDLLFVYELKVGHQVQGEHEITTTLSFQPCDPYACLPPNEIKVKNKFVK